MIVYNDGKVAKLAISGGHLVEISVEDIPYISGKSWCLVKSGYPVSRVSGKIVYLHVEIAKRAGLDTSSYIDHRDRNKLNCKRENLRPATNSQNQMNGTELRSNSSVRKGVSYDKRRGVFAAYIKVDQKKLFLGHFLTAEEAVEAREIAERELFGEYAT